MPLLFAAVVFAPRDGVARSSCPLTTAVAPFASTTNVRYAVTITDGGPGDLDGTVNGSCTAAVRLCRGTEPLCHGGSILDGRVRAGGDVARDARTVAAVRMSAALDALTTGETTEDACSVARFSLAAEEDASVAFRFRIATDTDDGRTTTRKSRIAVTCLPPTDRSDDASCTTGRAGCPAAAEPICGDGLVDRIGEQCDGSDAEACPGACSATCTCPAGPGSPQPPGVPTCGDGARNQDMERCDGADDELCPGACKSDCTCGTSAGDLNVAPLAVASASSMMTNVDAAVDGIVDGLPGDPLHEWISDGEGDGAWLRLTWHSPVLVDHVILHDRPNSVDNVTEGALLADDDGVPIPTGALAPDGAATDVMIGPRSITALTFMVLQSTGHNAGLAEIEVVAARKKPTTTTTTTTAPATSVPTTTATTTTTPTPTSTTTVTPTTTPASSSTATPTTLPPGGPTYYISPSGSDGADGKAPGSAWRTFAKAIPLLQPGDTLVLLDGTYTRGTTGLPRINCSSGAHNGTSDHPITLRADHERKAFLSSDGQQTGLEMQNCSWWNLDGLRAENADSTSGGQLDGFAFRFVQVDHVNGHRLLGAHNNRMQNTHVYAIENSQHVLLEECEAYFYHRHGFSIWQSRWITIRRAYANSMQYGTLGCCSTIDNRAYGDEAYSLYGTSDSIVENSISENQANGFQIHGIANSLDPSGNGGRRNRILGSISLNDSVPALVSSRSTSGTYRNARDNEFRDFVAANEGGNGIFLRGAAGTLVQNVTLYHSSGYSGLSADGGDSGVGGSCGSANPDGCSFTARNVLSVGNKGYGVEVSGSYASWMVEWSDAAGNAANYSSSETPSDTSGNIQSSQTKDVPGLGLGAGQCLLWAPAGSWLRGAGKGGANIGATIASRYVDGTLTSTPLWNQATGAFPCGALVPGINDGNLACANVHTRLNANANGCALP